MATLCYRSASPRHGCSGQCSSSSARMVPFGRVNSQRGSKPWACYHRVTAQGPRLGPRAGCTAPPLQASHLPFRFCPSSPPPAAVLPCTIDNRILSTLSNPSPTCRTDRGISDFQSSRCAAHPPPPPISSTVHSMEFCTLETQCFKQVFLVCMLCMCGLQNLTWSVGLPDLSRYAESVSFCFPPGPPASSNHKSQL